MTSGSYFLTIPNLIASRFSTIRSTCVLCDEAITGGAKEHIDGLSVNFPQWWFAASGSQTEPVLRLTAGAVNREILEEQAKRLIGVINQVQARNLSLQPTRQIGSPDIDNILHVKNHSG